MTGIAPEVTCHRLNTDPTFKPVCYNRRLGPDRAKAVQDEVVRLLKAGLIMEVQYPEWLANPVVVKKKNGKWRVCVDYTNLNKVCPKDSYPLPHIDRLHHRSRHLLLQSNAFRAKERWGDLPTPSQRDVRQATRSHDGSLHR